MSRDHHDPAALVRALRAGTQLRDKVVVVAVDPASLDDPQRLEPLAADLALGRALGIRMLTVCEPGSGGGPLDAQRPALRLVAALEKHAERGVALPAAGMITVHRLPPTPHNPALLPIVNPILLIHLCSLGYVPILLLPVADPAGEVVDAQPSVIAAAVAQAMGAVLVVAIGDAPPPVPSPGQLVTLTTKPGQLLADVLQNAPPPTASPVSLGEVKGILPS